MNFSEEEYRRYARHLSLPGFKEEHQILLKKAKVLVIGCGGLGTPVLGYLAAAGVGQLDFIEYDTIAQSNLQRQIFYETKQIGESKGAVMSQRLRALNPDIFIQWIDQKLTANNAISLFSRYDLIVDTSDNFPTRYLVNDTCLLTDKPLFYGAIFQWEGQVAVFNIKNQDGSRSANYRDLFPAPPKAENIPNCAEGGVFGVLPGVIGSLQATEVIKYVTGLGKMLVNELLIVELSQLIFRKIKFKSTNQTKVKELIDYELFCGIEKDKTNVAEVTKKELEKWIKRGEHFQLVDVRSMAEHERFNIGGICCPMDKIDDLKLNNDAKIVFYCATGKRSGKACAVLKDRYPKLDIFSLKDGVVSR